MTRPKPKTREKVTARDLLARLCGARAEALALDMDHANKDHSRWYADVKRARRFLSGKVGGR